MTTDLFDRIVRDFQLVAQLTVEIAPFFGPQGVAVAAGTAGGAALAYKLLPALRAGIAAHEAATGKPLTMDDLHEIPLIPEPVVPPPLPIVAPVKPVG